jgi:hypothetical protein
MVMKNSDPLDAVNFDPLDTLIGASDSHAQPTNDPLNAIIGFTPSGNKTPNVPPSPEGPARRAPIGADPDELKKYADMPISEVAQSAVQHFVPSVTNMAEGIGHAIVNPTETLGALKQIGQGAYSKAQGALGVQQNPNEKANTEALLDALGSHYAETYGTKGGFKKAIATDPASVGADLSLPFTMGAGLGANAAGLTGRAARLAGTIGTVLDPIQAGLATAKTVGNLGSSVMRSAQGISTGISPNLFKIAANAGKTSDPDLRAAFLTHLSGNGDATELATTAQRALSEIKAQKSAEYMASKAGITANKTPLDFAKIDQAIADARTTKTQFGGVQGAFKPANDALNEVEKLVNNFKNAHPQAQTLEGFDNLKQAVWDLRDQYSNSTAQNSLSGVYNAVKDTIIAKDPAYAKLMETYSNGLNNTTNILKTLGLGNNVAASSAVAKMLRATKTSDKQNLLDQISKTQSGKTLPYMLAGQALNPWVPGGGRSLLDLALGYGAAVVHPGFAGGIAASSPRLMGLTNYALGKGSQIASNLTSRPITYAAEQLGQSMPATQPPPQTPSNVGRILNTIKQRETGAEKNPYTARNPTSTASGAYQFIDGTWNGLTRKYHIGTQYSRASDAPPDIQDAVASRYVQDILEENNGDISKVPLVWYSGNPEGNISQSAIEKNQGLTPKSYQTAWMRTHNQTAATGGAITRATGGRVGHEHLVTRLMRAAERAKKTANSVTEPLLQAPDEHIVKALHIANEAIQ